MCCISWKDVLYILKVSNFIHHYQYKRVPKCHMNMWWNSLAKMTYRTVLYPLKTWRTYRTFFRSFSLYKPRIILVTKSQLLCFFSYGYNYFVWAPFVMYKHSSHLSIINPIYIARIWIIHLIYHRWAMFVMCGPFMMRITCKNPVCVWNSLYLCIPKITLVVFKKKGAKMSKLQIVLVEVSENGSHLNQVLTQGSKR